MIHTTAGGTWPDPACPRYSAANPSTTSARRLDNQLPRWGRGAGGFTLASTVGAPHRKQISARSAISVLHCLQIIWSCRLSLLSPARWCFCKSCVGPTPHARHSHDGSASYSVLLRHHAGDLKTRSSTESHGTLGQALSAGARVPGDRTPGASCPCRPSASQPTIRVAPADRAGPRGSDR